MRKKLGQHFLHDAGTVDRILQLAEIHADEHVLEIGPGKGILTRALAHTAQSLVAIEYDPALTEHLQQQFCDVEHVRILQGDARSIRYDTVFSQIESDIRPKIKVVANLPYYAAVPILKGLFRSTNLWSQGILMFQKEVAERITASPGSKAYGALSIAAQYYSLPQYGFTVSPQAFSPPPQVHSAVITLNFREPSQITIPDEASFFQLVNYAFQTRRKTLKNSLVKHGGGQYSEALLESALQHLHLNPRIRAEELSIHDFANLSHFLFHA